MVIKQLVLKKRPHYFFISSILLKDFDKAKLKKHNMIALINLFIILTMKKLRVMSILCI